MPIKIQSVDLYPIYDSSGGQTLEAAVNGATASAPGGISTSAYEAKTVPIAMALKAFEKTKKELIGTFSQSSFDAKLEDLMPQLGAQATTALSLAFYANEQSLRAAAATYSPANTFPNLIGNVLGGGSHTPFKGGLSVQEILIIPKSKTLPAAIETNFKIWREVGDALAKRGPCGLNYEAAWTADISDDAALALVARIAKKARAAIGIDIAASQLYKSGEYVWSNQTLKRESHIERVLELIKKYKLVYVEDPVQQDDFSGFATITAAVSGNALICGDDLVATNLERLKRAIREKAINALIVKPNQTGTVSAAVAVISHATKNKLVPVMSHRSRETSDTAVCTLAQLCPLAKFGVAGIRTAKLNGLLRLWRAAVKPKLAAPAF
ncbi:MAG: enolase C-terminal domain-like protein [Candidatus Aenigmatarchaeota archaeon]